MAIRGSTIAQVGDSAPIARLAGPATKVLGDGKGMVVPGFMDGHTHFIYGGFQLTSVDLRDAASPQEFIARLKAYAARLSPGEWITGGDWDHERWPGTPLPERSWIDSVTPNNPVFVNRLDGHMALANSAALRRAGISRSTADIPGGVIVRDRTGEPTGVLKDEAQNPVLAAIPTPTPAQSDSAIARALRWAASKGVTAVADVSVPWFEVAALKRARLGGRSPPGSRCTSRCRIGIRWRTRCGPTAWATSGFGWRGSKATSTGHSAHDRALLRAVR